MSRDLRDPFSPMAALTRPSFPPTGGGMTAGPSGQPPEPPMPSLQVFPWWYYPLPASQYLYVDSFDANGAPQIIAPGAVDVVVAGTEFRVLDGQRAVITGIALGVNVPTAADDYFFTLKRNNGAIEGVRRLRNFSVAANASVREFGGFAIKLEPNDVVQWTVTNSGAAPISIFLSYQGWMTSVNDIARVEQGSNY